MTSNNIPKIIHYVWLGRGEKNETIKKCIRTWEKFCPDYKIIEWNEEKIKNIDNIYLKEAIEYKYWAFASDYIRLYALYTFGGLYFDTDLEVTANINEFLYHDFFCSFEVENFPSTAFLGAQKNNKLIAELLKYYSDRHFIIDGSPDLTTNPRIFRDIFSCVSPKIQEANENSRIEILNNNIIYPSSYFCKAIERHKNYAVHHFEGSWCQPQDITFTRIIWRLWRFEIIKTISAPKAKYPPDLCQRKAIISIAYKNRRRIYLTLLDK